MQTYITVMMMLQAAAWKDILEKPVKPILNAIPNEHVVHYNEKKMFIEVIIDNEHRCKCIHTPLS